MLLLGAVSGPATADHFIGLAGDPGLRSASVLVIDGGGRQIYARDADSVRPIASITKLMTAMVVIDSKPDFSEPISITRDDRDLVQLTGSRLHYGATLTRGQLLRLALMASENRAAMALGRTWPGGIAAFVAAMNRKAQALGMRATHFVDPAGLRVENVSTARDLALMLVAASRYPMITEASTTLRSEVSPWSDRGPLVYGNTNRLLRNQNWDISMGKTGYINEAGRCLVMRVTIEGEPVSIVLLNSFGKLTPFGDSNRLRHWMLGNS
ncbi:peptidase S11 [Halieaceae bacterium IMCC14734]|uniref:Peptidase S11 n=2 Tax=Candidatus Litorirhabdus singularis TaxID=2518993 RepID=A0ABT3TEI6_9GAMM|nr:peptidase S11 [Candidatus Litorirhabdus singularis]